MHLLYRGGSKLGGTKLKPILNFLIFCHVESIASGLIWNWKKIPQHSLVSNFHYIIGKGQGLYMVVCSVALINDRDQSWVQIEWPLGWRQSHYRKVLRCGVSSKARQNWKCSLSLVFLLISNLINGLRLHQFLGTW